jgi:hypothetical protein
MNGQGSSNQLAITVIEPCSACNAMDEIGMLRRTTLEEISDASS